MRFLLPFFGLLMLCMEMSAYETEKAGTTIANAPYVVDTMMLDVQSGANYIRIEPKHLPATVVYMPNAPFGTIPELMILGDTLPKQMFFAECVTGWMWTISKSETTALVQVSSHEAALILAAPYMCKNTTSDTIAVACDSLLWKDEWRYASGDYEYLTTNAAGCDSIVTLRLTINHATVGDTTAEACNSFKWYGTRLTISDDYTHVLTNAAGCDSTVTLHLTILTDCQEEPTKYDTTFFCRGFNTEREDTLEDGTVHLYRQYVFQSPEEWDYMEGVILDGRSDSTLLDLRRAETNLYGHYVEELTPVTSIRWSVLYEGEGKYVPLAVTDEPQWIETGYVAVQVCFLCGEMFNTEFPTDIEHVSQEVVSTKRIENGRVVIIRGGEKYDIFGTKIQ